VKTLPAASFQFFFYEIMLFLDIFDVSFVFENENHKNGRLIVLKLIRCFCSCILFGFVHVNVPNVSRLKPCVALAST